MSHELFYPPCNFHFNILCSFEITVKILSVALEVSLSIFEALVGCHDILIWGKSPIKLSQLPVMILAVHWDVERKFKQKLKKNIHMYKLCGLAIFETLFGYYDILILGKSP